MNNVITLHADKRWKAVIDYRTDEGPKSVEHYFEEISIFTSSLSTDPTGIS